MSYFENFAQRSNSEYTGTGENFWADMANPKDARIAVARDGRATFLAKNSDSSCGDLILTGIDPGHDGGPDSAHPITTPVNDWLDALNTSALNEPIPTTLPTLEATQLADAKVALSAIHDLMTAMKFDPQHPPDVNKLNDANRRLMMVFGGDPSSPNAKKPIEYFKQIDDYVNCVLNQQAHDHKVPVRVRLATSDITHMTYVGLNNQLNPEFTPFMQVGGRADCSLYGTIKP